MNKINVWTKKILSNHLESKLTMYYLDNLNRYSLFQDFRIVTRIYHRKGIHILFRNGCMVVILFYYIKVFKS